MEKSNFKKAEDFSIDVIAGDIKPIKCKCGGLIYPEYIKPIPHPFEDRAMDGTGQYRYKEKCEKCLLKIQGIIKQKEIEKMENNRINKINKNMEIAGFLPRHRVFIDKDVDFKMDIPNERNLFIFGGPGTGKTHFACKRLYSQINKGNSGRIEVFPSLLMKLRQAAKTGGDSYIYNDLTSLDCLVIDDFLVGRSTDYVLEVVYMIIEYWYSNLKTGLTITSNLDLAGVAKHDDRISSRIAEMCEIVEMSGRDFRL